MKKENNELVKLHYREGTEWDMYYRDWSDIMKEFGTHDGMIHVAVYCSYTKSIETGDLLLRDDGRVMMFQLKKLKAPCYSISEIELGELNKEYYILKNHPMEYHEAVSWGQGMVFYLLHLQTGLIEMAIFHEWIDHGNYGEFTVVTLDGWKKLQASGYGKEYVFLEP